MLRLAFLAVMMVAPLAVARADPEGMCGLEDATAVRTPCPPYVTYDEDGREVGGAHRE